MFNREYKQYLKSDTWKWLRSKILFDRNYTCERCGSRKRLEVHHKTYTRIFHEIPNDLEVLCYRCHCIQHGKPIKDNSFRQRNRNKKQRIKLSPEERKRLIEEKSKNKLLEYSAKIKAKEDIERQIKQEKMSQSRSNRMFAKSLLEKQEQDRLIRNGKKVSSI